MSSAAVTYTFANSTTADGTQVNQNFTDLVSFINGSVPHSDGTGGAADVRVPKFGQAALNGKKIHWASYSGTTSTLSGQDGCADITHGAGFTPSGVIVTPISPNGGGTILTSVDVESVGATTFRVRHFFGAASIGNGIVVAAFYICLG